MTSKSLATIEPRELSLLAASIVLVNGLSRLVGIPSHGYLITIAGVQWAIEISGRLLFMLLLAAIVTVGAETILRSHPVLSSPAGTPRRYSTAVHWILPALAAFGGSAAVSLLPGGPRWWLGLALVSILLVAGVAGEFIVLDRKDARHDPAASGLSTLGLAILAIILAAVHAGSTRSALAVPAVGATVAIISLRLLDLRAPRSRKMMLYALGIGLAVSQLALPMVFLPIPSVTFSLSLVLATYTMIGFAQSVLVTGRLPRQTIYEYLLVDALAVLVLTLLPSG